MMGLFNRTDSNSIHLLKGLKYRSAFTKNARDPGRTEAGNETVVPPEVPLTINSSIRCPLFFCPDVSKYLKLSHSPGFDPSFSQKKSVSKSGLPSEFGDCLILECRCNGGRPTLHVN